MQKLVECVPNISEGRDRRIIDSVTAVIGEVKGARLLDVDAGGDTNRTVITFIGPPEAVAEAAFRVVRRAAELIDMSRHHGAHPRHGATDVCPFVPVRGVTMAECVELARQVGRRIGSELDIPVYLYEDAASSPQRRNLADVRKGEYEALPGKLGTTEWAPDFGPTTWNERTARTGATNVAARGFLVAYNVNLNTRDKALATQVALDIKEAGRAVRDAQGNIVTDAGGNNVLEPGPYRLLACKAVGWYIPAFERAQVSINLVNTSVTKPHQAFEACDAAARDRGARATGSELVGLVPESDLLAAGRFYLRRAGHSAGLPRRHLIENAIQSLGLRELGPFDPAEKVIEYRAGLVDGPLVSMTNRAFADELSTDAPAPGGGSVAALSAAHGAALAAMVANLTVGRKKYAAVEQRMKDLAEQAQEMKDYFLAAVDDDTAAFNAVMAAYALPKGTPGEAAARDTAVAAATLGATLVPLGVLERVPAALALAGEVAEHGNTNSLSDAGVAALTLMTGAEGAYYNVLINLATLATLPGGIPPDLRPRAVDAMARSETAAARTRTTVRQRLES
jgi:glutamate formiminotransferase/formiminotetrahydrofolate cyclodeaminase